MNKLFNIFTPLVTIACLAVFKNIWNFKRYLKNKSNTSDILVKAYNYYFHRYGAWIGYRSELSQSVIFPHGYYGIFISNNAVVKDNVVIFQQVTIGSNTIDLNLKKAQRHSPIVEKNCYIGAGAKIIGGITVEENCRIGANAVVFEDVPSNSVVVVEKTRIIKKKERLDNKFYPLNV